MKVFLVFILFLSNMCPIYSDMISLKNKYAWPKQKPACPKNLHGWFYNQKSLRKILTTNMKVIVELGSWLGRSTRFLLDNAPNATVIAIDHWDGSEEHLTDKKFATILPVLYETFLVNCWQYKNRLIPVKNSSLLGLQDVYNEKIKPDLVYIDASHDYDAVTKDLEKTFALFPNTIICGDDWGWDPVRTAVEDFSARNSFMIFSEGNFYSLKKRDPIKWGLFYSCLNLDPVNKHA